MIVHDGSADSVRDVREWALVDALASEGYRVILADHCGHGRSDEPHDPAAYAMALPARSPMLGGGRHFCLIGDLA